MRTFFLAALLLGSSALAQTRAEVEKWPVLYKYVEDEQPKQQTFTAQEAALLQQIIQNANSRPELRKYRRSLPDWAQKNLTLNDVMLSQVAPFRTPQPERLILFTFSDPETLLVVLSGGAKNSAWLISGMSYLCAVKEAFTLRDIDANGRREFALVSGCGDGPFGERVLDIAAWQGGELRLTHEGRVSSSFYADRIGKFEEATVHVRRGPRPQVIAVVNTLNTTYDYVGGKDVERSRKETTVLQPIQSPVKDANFTVTRLW